MEVVIGVGLYLAICFGIGIWLTPKINRYRRKAAQKRRDAEIEAEMRQDIADQSARRRVADKILRESGERP